MCRQDTLLWHHNIETDVSIFDPFWRKNGKILNPRNWVYVTVPRGDVPN